MIGELDRACWDAVRDARAGRRANGWSGRAGEAYDRAHRRTTRAMRTLGQLPQLELWGGPDAPNAPLETGTGSG